MSETPTIPIFDNGSQYLDWQNANCCRCTKYHDAPQTCPPACPIEYALSLASVMDGKVTPEIARRAGYMNDNSFLWMCNEVEWTPEWIAEWKRRHPEAHLDVIQEPHP
jgi:hypothetical protein